MSNPSRPSGTHDCTAAVGRDTLVHDMTNANHFYRASLCAGRLLLAATTIASIASAQDATSQPATSQPSDSGGGSAIIDVADKSAIDANKGKEIVVEGVIDTAAWSGSGKVMRIEFKGNQQSKLHAVVFASKKKDFDEAYSGDVAKTLTGARVRVKGKLEDYQNRPEIKISSTSQLTILEPRPSTPTSNPSGG
jgi:DNA/RNA endonuclease YhcR with UshA esterase domain